MNRIERMIAGAAVSMAYAIASGPYLPPRPHPQRGTLVAKNVAPAEKKTKNKDQTKSSIPRTVERVDVIVDEKPARQTPASQTPNGPAKK